MLKIQIFCTFSKEYTVTVSPWQLLVKKNIDESDIDWDIYQHKNPELIQLICHATRPWPGYLFS